MKDFFNTKVKKYVDGTTNTTYCSKPIFSYPVAVEENEIVSSDIEERLNSPPTWEEVEEELQRDRQKKEEKREVVHNDSLKRAKDRVFDIVYQNKFRYFLTITISPEHFDRENPQEVIKKLRVWLNHMQQRHGLSYVLIPERHKKSNGIHCHALINGALYLSDSGRALYNGKAYKVSSLKKMGVKSSQCRQVFNVNDWKYGYSTAIEVYGNQTQFAHYITKYITKDIKKIFGQYYWSSRDLVRETEIELKNTDFDSVEKVIYSHCPSMSFKYDLDQTYQREDKNAKKEEKNKEVHT